MMSYRVSINELMSSLETWDHFITGRGKIHLIACGGTALTLLGFKESTKDIDFLVPGRREYERLIQFLQRAGYERQTSFGWTRPGEDIIFDLYPENKVYMTELLSSPFGARGHIRIKEWKHIYLGVLNFMDLIISKMFRGSEADIQDSLVLLNKEKIDIAKLKKRYQETAQYDNNPERVLKNFEVLLKRWKQVSREPIR